MFQKIAAILLLFLYLIPSVGVSCSVHYCGGEISNVAFIITDKHVCGCDEKEMNSDCCKDKIVSVKIKDLHKSETVKIIIDAYKSIIAPPSVLIQKKILLVQILDTKSTPFIVWDTGPPVEKLYIRYNSFLI